MMENSEDMVSSVQNQWDMTGEVLNSRSKRHIKKKISLIYLFKNICASREACMDWLKNKSLIPRIMFCPTCQRKMKFEPNDHAIDGYVWICKECPVSPSYFSVRHGSWLEGRDAPLVDILLFTYLWAHGCTSEQISKETNMPLNTVKDWSLTYLNICASVYQKRLTSEAEFGSENDLERKESYAAMWREKNKYKDPFFEFLKDADSL